MPQTPPLAWQPTIGRERKTWSFSLRNERFEPHKQNPNFQHLHLKDEPTKHLPLKANRTHTNKTHKATANLEKVLKGIVHGRTHPRGSPRFSVKEVYFLKSLLRFSWIRSQQVPSLYSPTISLRGHYFFFKLYTF